MRRLPAIAVLVVACGAAPEERPAATATTGGPRSAVGTDVGVAAAPRAPPPAAPPTPRCAEPVAPSEAGAPGLSAPATDVSIAGGISLYVPGPYLTDGIAFDRCGAVETIGPPATDRIRYTVVLAGADAPEERTFGVSVPEARLLPFDVGDVVHVRIGVRRIQIHAVLSGIVTDQAGRLLLGFSGEGDTTWAPGWSVAMGPITERIGSVRGHVLDVAYLGTRGRTAETAFVRLRTSDGSWLVLGSARTLARSRRGGPVVPPHDFSPYSTFAVLRER